MKHVVPSEAIILAGGLGTRLRSVVSDVPKPMAPVLGRPFLEYQLDYWIDQGINRCIVSIGYLGSVIKDYFGDVHNGCELIYVQEDVPLGTGGALRQILNNNNVKQPQVVLLNGDTWYEVSLMKLMFDAKSADKPITMALKPVPLNDRYGGVGVDENGLVTEFGIKAGDSCLINGGVYLLDVNSISACLEDLPDKFSLEQDFLVPMALNGNVVASIQDVTFIDIGVPDDYAKAPFVIGKRNAL